MAAPTALPENDRLWFNGLALPARARLAAPAAARLEARWGEWVRPVAGAATPGGGDPAGWVIDFPPSCDARERQRAGEAWRLFCAAGRRPVGRGTGAELRIALAKVDRYLAAPARRVWLRWGWVESRCLPDASLLVLARDDEFLAGVVASSWFHDWIAAAGGRATARVAAAFPFPWAPGTGRSALSTRQEEHRAAVVRAWRDWEGSPGPAARAALDECVGAAYGWDGAASARDHLAALHAARCAR